MIEGMRPGESQSLEEIAKTSKFFEKAFGQAKEQKLRTKDFYGRFFPDYYKIWQENKEKLASIDATLPVDVFLANRPLSSEDLDRVLRGRNFGNLARIRNSQFLALESLTHSVLIPEMRSQELADDALYKPDTYYRQIKRRTCYMGNYSMVFTAITGKKIDEPTILDEARKKDLLISNTVSGIVRPHNNGDLTDVDDDVLLTTLQTPAFRDEFGDIQVGVLRFIGADFNDIANTTNRLRAKARQKGLSFESYFIAMLGSEVIVNGWHNSVLVGVDTDTVIVHDPSNHRYEGTQKPIGMPNKKIPKDEFIQRWASTYLKGDYIFALKPE